LSHRSSYLLALLLLALARPSAAQSFPSAGAYVPLPCGNGPMTDPANDTPNATGALDLVGTAPLPAGFHAADAQFLFLRMRVAGNPLQGARLLPDAWGYELDLDGDVTTYELLISVSGTGMSDQVAIFRHPTTQVPNDPADPSAVPPAFTYPFATHAQVSAASSSLGGGTDFFIDVAVPWTDLGTLGVQRNTPVYVWAGSSTVANALDLDLACVSGAGGQLGSIGVGLTAPDPAAAPGGGVDGGVGGTGPRTLEGGPGCSVGGAAADGGFALALIALLGIRRRRA
jgi:MYXO-CTERM domain-containing protein